MKTERINISNNDKLSLISNIATMLSAGIPILETVDSLLEDSKGNSKKVLEAIREDLMQGKHLYATFSRFPLIFDKVTVNLIKASEEAGTLETSLKDLKQNIKRDMEFSDRLKSAMIYPIFILGVFVAVLLMILVVVIPKISTVFSRLTVDLPLPTRILIFASNILLTYTAQCIAGVFLISALVIAIYKRQKRTILHILFSFPLISDLIREIDLTRFTRSLYLLLSSGVTINNALELAQEVVLKKELVKAISHCREGVLAGKKLSEGLKDSRKVIPAIMIKITEAGERTGTLDKSMQDASEFLDYQVQGTLKTLTVLIEPIMLVVVGGLVGGMMLSIIAPIYSMIGQVGAR